MDGGKGRETDPGTSGTVSGSMIDAHCHVDQIDSPEEIVKEAEARTNG